MLPLKGGFLGAPIAIVLSFFLLVRQHGRHHKTGLYLEASPELHADMKFFHLINGVGAFLLHFDQDGRIAAIFSNVQINTKTLHFLIFNVSLHNAPTE